MKHAVRKKDVLWGYISQFLSIASSLLLLPFILRYLGQEEIGLWYVFVALAGLVQLLEFGLLPTVSRFISYVYSGAKDITYNKTPECKDEEINKELLNDLIIAAREIYFKITTLAFVGIVILGNIYLYSLHTTLDFLYVMSCWTLYGISICVQLYFGYYNSILKGRGDQTVLNKVIVLTKSVLLAVSIPMLVSGQGLISLAIGSVIAVIIDRWIITKCVYNNDHYIIKNYIPLQAAKELKTIVWQSAKDMGIVQLGNFLCVRGSILIVSSFIGLKAAAAYGLTVQVTMVIVIVASMLFGLNLPRMTAEQALQKYSSVKRLFKKSLLTANAIYMASAFSLVFLGDFLLKHITQQTHFLPTEMLVLYLICSLLEMNYSLCTSYLTTKNQIPFVKSMIITGMSIILLSFVVTYYLKAGVLGVILSQLFVQSLYNNWKWPLTVYQDLRNVKS
jgi:O-antigen/teichoic acid export membrane protein